MKSPRIASLVALLPAFLVVAWLGPPATGPLYAGESVPMDDHVVRLPPLFVVDEEDAWRYATVPGFEVISRCGDPVTMRALEAFTRALKKLEAFIPPEFEGAHTRPYVMLLASEETTAPSITDLLARAAPNGGTPGTQREVRFLKDLMLDDAESTAVFVMLNERAINEEIRQATPSFGSAGRIMVASGLPKDPLPIQFAPSYVETQLRRRSPALPEWVVVGLVRLYAAADLAGTSVRLPPLAKEVVDDWMKQKDPVLPVAELVSGPAGSGSTATAEDRERWAAQAALLVRWVLDGTEAQRQRFWSYVLRAAEGPADEKLFQEWFRVDYATAAKRLRDYVAKAGKKSVVFAAKGSSPVPNFKLRDATEAEVARIKGAWERMEIGYVRSMAPEFVFRYEQQAGRTLERAMTPGQVDPELEGMLGLYLVETGRDAEARPHFEVAAANGTARPRELLELARLRYLEAVGHLESAKQRLDPASILAIIEPLEAAHRQAPSLAEVYRLAAEVLLRSATPATAEQLAMLRSGLRSSPRDRELLYATTLLHAAYGRPEDVATLAQRGLDLAPGDLRFRRLLDAAKPKESGR